MSDFTLNVPDCLVLKLEEYDVDTKHIDTTLYVLYDQKEDNYVIRGSRRWSPKLQACDYSFICQDRHDLANFISYVICKTNLVHETLFNYDNLPYDSNDITFEFMRDHDHRDYEISGYDNRKFSKKRLLRNLKMIRNVFNYYN